MPTTGHQRQIRPMELAVELAAYLASRGIGVVARDIFVGTLPTSPVNAVMVHVDGGARPQYGDVLSRPHVQIQVRDTDVSTGAARAALIFETFDKEAVQTASFIGRMTADHYAGNWFLGPNNHPVHPLNFSFVGRIRAGVPLT